MRRPTPTRPADSRDADQVAHLLAQARRLRGNNRRGEARALCRAAWDHQPTDVDTLCQLGALLHELGASDIALLCLQRAAARQLELYAVQFGLGTILHALGRLTEALTHYDRALVLRPGDVETLNNRGPVLQALGRHDDALRSFDAALAERPDLAVAWYNRGNLLRQIGRATEALASYDRALALQPDLVPAWNNRGVALQQLNRHADAMADHDRALALRPDDGDVLSARGAALLVLNRHAEALECYDRAVAVAPDLAEARLNRAHCQLALGDFARGWEGYEARWHLPMFQEARRDLPQPRWHGGKEITGKTILLWAEQGMGDTLQFCRYVPLVAARAQVVLEAPQLLLRLLCSLPGGGQIIVPGQPPPRFDLHCPLMSLPRAFGTDFGSIPNRMPYLAATPADVAVWHQRLAGLTGLRVGLVWAGNPRAFEAGARPVDQRRSCGLAAFAPLARLHGIDLVSLQKGTGAAQARTPPAGLLVHDWTDHLHDFADTAALIEALDLVISVDTSVVHLAGALGKPVWVLSRFDACWRWLVDRDDSPWYPSARVFRQAWPGDWAGVMARVVVALRGMLG